MSTYSINVGEITEDYKLIDKLKSQSKIQNDEYSSSSGGEDE